MRDDIPAGGLALDVRLDAPPERTVERARELATTGVAGVFTFEGQHDVFLPLALAASATDLGVMTNVAIAIPRSPMHLAHAAWDLQALSRGRFRLGLGSQVKPHIEHRYGARWVSPARQMGEIVMATRTILQSWQERTPLRFEGEFTRHTLMGPTFDPGPNPYGVPPVLLGALGPVMTRTAAEVADGLLVMPFHSARHFRERTLPAVEEGLARRRVDAPFAIVPQAILAMGDTDEEVATALVGVRWLLAFYGSTPAYRPVVDVEGAGDLQPRLQALQREGRYDEMAGLIDDDLVRRLAVVGSPAECAEQLRERFGDVADRACVYFPGSEPTPAQLTALVDACR